MHRRRQIAPRSLRTTLGLSFALVLAISVVAAATVFSCLRLMERDYDAVISKTGPIISNARHLYRLVVDMETGQRGFVITGADEFLEPYNAAIGAINQVMDEQSVLIADNPNLQASLAQVGAAIDEWKEQAATPQIALR